MDRLTVGYVRVSTPSEAQATSVEGQCWEMEKAGCDRVIAERRSAYSGERRPGWEELRALVAKGLVGRVLVVDLSRLARDGSDQEFLEECHLANCTVADLKGVVLENQTIQGLALTGVMSVMNRVQSRLISVKVRDGLRRRREAGYAARGKLPFGYAHIGGQVVPCPVHWAAARQLIDLVIRYECNVYQTLKALPEDFPRKFSPIGFHGWLKNPILRGGIGRGAPRGTQNYAEVEWGRCPPLISAPEWALILRMLEKRRRGPSPRSGRISHLFGGLIRCESCGKNLQWHTKDNPKSPGVRRYACKRPYCQYVGNGVREDTLRAAVIDLLVRRFASRLAKLAAEGAEPPEVECPELIVYREQLAQLQLLETQGVTGLGTSITRLRDQIVTLQALPSEAWPGLYEELFRTPEALSHAPDELLRPVLLHFVSEILYQGGPNSFQIKLRQLPG
jgi:DNA invertase Pin-like site-specific DNA recombinase